MLLYPQRGKIDNPLELRDGEIGGCCPVRIASVILGDRNAIGKMRLMSASVGWFTNNHRFVRKWRKARDAHQTTCLKHPEPDTS